MTSCRIAALALTLLLVLTVAPTSPASAATVLLDGVTVGLQPGTTQVVTVNHTRGWHARVTFWRRISGGLAEGHAGQGRRTGYGGLVVGSRREAGRRARPRWARTD